VLGWASGLSVVVWVMTLASIVWDVVAGKGFRLNQMFPPFEDITAYVSRFRVYHMASFYTARGRLPHAARKAEAFAYPPGAAPIYAAFYAFRQPVVVYCLLMAAWTVVACVGAYALLRRAGVTAARARWAVVCLATLGYPVVFLADRANIELIVWMVVVAGALLCLRGQDVAGAICFGIAASVKLYPILLLGVFLGRAKGLRSMMWGVLAALGAMVAALWYSGPTLVQACTGFVQGVLRFKEQQGESTHRTAALFDHSLFSPAKLPGFGHEIVPAHWTAIYYVTAGGLAAAVFLLRVRKLPWLNRFTFLSALMILLPPVSYEYTVVHMYLPLVLLTGVLLRDDARLGWVRAGALFCLAAAMWPLSLVGDGSFAYAGVVEMVVLAAVAGLAAASAWTAEARGAFGSGAKAWPGAT
jgi:hypothetical protein